MMIEVEETGDWFDEEVECTPSSNGWLYEAVLNLGQAKIAVELSKADEDGALRGYIDIAMGLCKSLSDKALR